MKKKIEVKKIRFVAPIFMKEIIDNDKIYFGVQRGTILNKLIEYYSSKKIKKADLVLGENLPIQFNLTNKNNEMYFKILQENDFYEDAEFMRSILFDYVSHPRHKREEIVFFDIIKTINEAILNNKKVNILYNKVVRTVNPYAIKYSVEESRLYLFCYCEKNDDYRNYRISKIGNIMLSSKDLEVKNEKYIDSMKKNFDPFRSYGRKVKVKLTDNGLEILEKALVNRPKYIFNEKEKIYEFECDNKLAQIYFAQFYDEIEILEPKELREWFVKKIKNMNKIYDIKD